MLGLALDAVLPPRFPLKGTARLRGWQLLGAVVLVGWFGRKMRQARIPFRLDQQTATLVAHGPFRYSLNPGYLSLAMVHAGAALLE